MKTRRKERKARKGEMRTHELLRTSVGSVPNDEGHPGTRDEGAARDAVGMPPKSKKHRLFLDDII